MSSKSAMQQVILRICTKCEGGKMAEGRQAIEAALLDAGLKQVVSIRAVECLGSCDAPQAVALQSDGRASYVFSGIDLEADAADIAATCAAYLAVPKGWIEDARPCGRLRLCLRARIPALAS